jgi:hypothetical protein
MSTTSLPSPTHSPSPSLSSSSPDNLSTLLRTPSKHHHISRLLYTLSPSQESTSKRKITELLLASDTTSKRVKILHVWSGDEEGSTALKYVGVAHGRVGLRKVKEKQTALKSLHSSAPPSSAARYTHQPISERSTGKPTSTPTTNDVIKTATQKKPLLPWKPRLDFSPPHQWRSVRTSGQKQEQKQKQEDIAPITAIRRTPQGGGDARPARFYEDEESQSQIQRQKRKQVPVVKSVGSNPLQDFLAARRYPQGLSDTSVLEPRGGMGMGYGYGYGCGCASSEGYTWGECVRGGEMGGGVERFGGWEDEVGKQRMGDRAGLGKSRETKLEKGDGKGER